MWPQINQAAARGRLPDRAVEERLRNLFSGARLHARSFVPPGGGALGTHGSGDTKPHFLHVSCDSLFFSEVEDRFQFYCFLYSKCEIQVSTCFCLALTAGPFCRTRTVQDASLALLPAGPRQRTGTSGPPPPPPPPPLPPPAPQCPQLHLYN